MTRLVACASCSVYTRIGDPMCPGCGTRLVVDRGAFLRTASAVLMGLSLTACPSDDDGDDTIGGTASSSPTDTATGSTSAGTDDPSMTSTTVDPTTFGSSAAAYGVPQTTSGGETDATETTSSTGGTDTDTDTTGTGTTGGGAPLYGVVET